MEALECIKTRRSVRKFKYKDISEDDLAKILEAASYAPSSGNLQNWEFVIVKNTAQKKRIAENCLGQKFISTAPVIVVICSNQDKITPYGERGKTLFAIQNTSAAAQNLMLAAHSLGIGSCWIGAFEPEGLSEILNLPGNVIPMAVIPIGYPEGSTRVTPRETLENITHIDKY